MSCNPGFLGFLRGRLAGCLSQLLPDFYLGAPWPTSDYLSIWLRLSVLIFGGNRRRRRLCALDIDDLTRHESTEPQTRRTVGRFLEIKQEKIQ